MTFGQSIWHCKCLGEDENGIIAYSAPTEYKLRLNHLSINPYSAEYSTTEYGKQVECTWKMKAKKSEFQSVFSEGDLLYVEGNSPDTQKKTYVNGENANARVQAVLPYLMTIDVLLEIILP